MSSTWSLVSWACGYLRVDISRRRSKRVEVASGSDSLFVAGNAINWMCTEREREAFHLPNHSS